MAGVQVKVAQGSEVEQGAYVQQEMPEESGNTSSVSSHFSGKNRG